MTVVFVYGTLTDPARLSAVLDRGQLGPPAVCDGLQRVDGQYPTLAPGEQTRGRLLSTPDIAALDSYEGVDRGLYCRLPVPLSSDATTTFEPPFGVESTELYVGSPQLLGVDDVVEWPHSGTLRQQVERYVDSHSVRIRPVSH